MKNCTLRKLESGEIICTVDERPKQTQWYLDDVNQVRIVYINDYDYWAQRKDYKCIIASTIPNVGKKLKVNYNNKIYEMLSSGTNKKRSELIKFNTELEYTEEKNQIIIKL